MGQISYGTITITDTNDIERIYMVYAGSGSDTTSPDKTNFNLWKTDITQVSGNYIWQRTVIKKSGINITSSNFQEYYGDPVCITGPEGAEGDPARNIVSVTPYYYLSTTNTGQTGGSWNTTPAPYPASGTYYYWTKTITTYDSGSPTESNPVLDNALNSANETARNANSTASDAWDKADNAEDIAQQASDDVEALESTYNTFINTQAKYFVRNSTGSIVIGSREAESPAVAFDVTNVNTYGYNTLNAPSYLALRYNATELAKLSTSALTFYKPNTTNRTMELTSEALTFYNPNDGTTAYATLNSNGLKLIKGGVVVGTSNTNNYVYISSENGPRVSINGYTPPDPTAQATLNAPQWREIIGTKFGVLSDGTLYASNAVINGAITATSLSTGGRTSSASATGTFIDSNGSIYGGNNKFTVTNGGILTAQDVVISGEISASSGNIGGWQIGTDQYKSLHNGSTNPPIINNNTIILSKGLTSNTSIAGSLGENTWTITAGTNFGVTTNGILYANGANITGTITIDPDTSSNIYTSTEVNDITDGITNDLTSKLNQKSIIFYGEGEPETTNYPFTQWELEDIPLHINDIYYDTKTGFRYRLFLDNQENYGWIKIEDSDIEKINQHVVIGDEGIIISQNVDNVNVKITGDRLSFRYGEKEVAYISGTKLYINQSVVLQQMDVGVKTTEYDINDNLGKGQWSWKVHPNSDGDNNLYLKWLG